VRLRIDLGYDGTDFHGWASQPNLRTVQGELEEALRVVLHLEDRPETTVAGRTDAGVHARGQVVHIDVAELGDEELQKLLRSLNGILPEDLQVFAVTPVSEHFDARFAALARRYSYRYVDAPAVDPLERHTVVFHPWTLDVELMNAASERLLGLNDYTAFCKRSEFGTSIRTLQEFSWHRDEYGVVVARIKADAFCHSMVRSMVGAMVHVGDGRKPVEWPRQLLDAGDRTSYVAPARGLVLEEVYYPAEADLQARQAFTRATRDMSELD
jgi:tRNA pseudouridine38-40 synthase